MERVEVVQTTFLSLTTSTNLIRPKDQSVGHFWLEIPPQKGQKSCMQAMPIGGKQRLAYRCGKPCWFVGYLSTTPLCANFNLSTPICANFDQESAR